MYQYPINIEDDPEFPNSLKLNAFEIEKIVKKKKRGTKSTKKAGRTLHSSKALTQGRNQKFV